jgi:hypothetical protein
MARVRGKRYFIQTMADYSQKPSFKETGLASFITEFALALAAVRDDIWRPSGTAIVIAPYLAITARHVVEDYWSNYERVTLGAGIGQTVDFAGSFSIVAFQVLQEGKTGHLWNVDRLWLSPFTDVAFLRLAPRSDEARNHDWRSVTMNLLPPAIGTQITGFGYHSSAINVNELEDRIEIEWKDSPTTTTGEVIEMHERGRDPVMLTFPCFRTNARFEGGMSGGPVFNAEGELCGVICTGLKLAEGETEHISYVASLWPSMGTNIDMGREGFPQSVFYPAFELAKHGLILARNWERVVLHKKADGTPQVGLRTHNSLGWVKSSDATITTSVSFGKS